MNWLDFVIVLGFILTGYIGYRKGFVFGAIELAGIFISIIIPLFAWVPMGRLFAAIGVAKRYSGITGFFVVLIFVMMVYYSLMHRAYGKIEEALLKSKVNSYFGIVPGVIEGTIVIAMLLTLIGVTPTSMVGEKTISGSYLSQLMLKETMKMAEDANDLFGPAIHEAMGFMTVKQSAEETITLGYKASDVEFDEQAENEMLLLVNQERVKRGLAPLTLDPSIRNVARNYSVYLLRNGIFSHTGLDGSTPLERMTNGGVQFTIVGENLAYAPTVGIAHSGLMASPGHRANILNPQYQRIGIGVAKAGRYHLMFTQNFAR